MEYFDINSQEKIIEGRRCICFDNGIIQYGPDFYSEDGEILTSYELKYGGTVVIVDQHDLDWEIFVVTPDNTAASRYCSFESIEELSNAACMIGNGEITYADFFSEN